MSKSLLVAGVLAVVSGLISLFFGIRINEFSLGNTLIVAGSIGTVGGLILIGLSSALAQLRRIAVSLGDTAMHRPVQPLESSRAAPMPADLRPEPAPARIPFPPRPPKNAPQRPAGRPDSRPEPRFEATADEAPSLDTGAHDTGAHEPHFSAAPSISASHEESDPHPAFAEDMSSSKSLSMPPQSAKTSEPRVADMAAAMGDTMYRAQPAKTGRNAAEESDELTMRLREMVETTAAALEKVRENAGEPRVAPPTARFGAPPVPPMSAPMPAPPVPPPFPATRADAPRAKSFFDSVWPKSPSKDDENEDDGLARDTFRDIGKDTVKPDFAKSSAPAVDVRKELPFAMKPIAEAKAPAVKPPQAKSDPAPAVAPKMPEAIRSAIAGGQSAVEEVQKPKPEIKLETAPHIDDMPANAARRFADESDKDEETDTPVLITDADLQGEIEDEPVTILKSGVIDEMAYTLYSDGSIEAELPQGTVRFASIADLRAYLETAA